MTMRNLLGALLGADPAKRRDPLLAATLRIRKRLDRPRDKRLDVLRVLHMANLLHISRHDAPLFEDAIEATTYGPIVPRAMAELTRHSDRTEDALHQDSLTQAQRDLIDEVCAHYEDVTSAQMVATVQADGGAWARRYRSGYAVDCGPRISMQELRDEVALRTRKAERLKLA